MPTPAPNLIQQIVDLVVSSPLWFFIGGLLTGILGNRLDRRLLSFQARFSATRRARLDRLTEQRQRLAVALRNAPQLQQLTAHRITVLHLLEHFLALIAVLLLGGLLGGAYLLGSVAPTTIAPTYPDLAPFIRVLVVILLGILIAAFLSGASRTKATATDLERALADALSHDGGATALLAVDEERRTAGHQPYYFETPPTPGTDKD